MKTRLLFPLVILFTLVLTMCKKDETPEPEPPPPTPQPRVLDTALVFSVDSCCVMIPNIFTPNGDGWNDVLWLGGMNIDTMHIDIRNGSGNIVFSNSNPLVFWDGTQTTTNGIEILTGFYTYTFYVRSTSGHELNKSNTLFLCKNPSTYCFSNTVPPQTNDMMGFPQCGFTMTTGEIFCFE